MACDELGCATPAVTAMGVGRRRFGRQRLDVVRLVCGAHADKQRRPLFRVGLERWLSAELAPFQRRWHKPAELDEYLRSGRDG